MKELADIFSNNQILVFGIVIFVFGLVLLGYLLTLIISLRKKNMLKKIDNKIVPQELVSNDIIIKENNELEVVLDKMQKTLDAKEEIDMVADFEMKQEEEAIISYQELIKAAKRDFPQMSDISKTDLEDKDHLEVVEVEESDISSSEQPLKSEEHKFKKSVFISPIYGVTENNNQENYCDSKINQEVLKKRSNSEINYVDISLDSCDDLEYEKENNDKFLEDLKSFRSNL